MFCMQKYVLWCFEEVEISEAYWVGEKMKKVLVLATNYPNNDGGCALMYVHTRSKYYVQHGIAVTVLNFAAEQGYIKDGIKVITLNDYLNSNSEYDTLIAHAANLRNHYKFLKKYDSRFKHIIFFFHGHEVLKLNKTYSKPYDYMKTSSWARMRFQDCYDLIKLAVWRKYLPKIAPKADFVFVSNCFYNEFKNFTGLSDEKLLNHVHIINNSVGRIFEEKSYDVTSKKEYDFITIRNMMDESVYCIDLLCEMANQNPGKKFLLIGRGHYFGNNKKPENIEWVDRFLSHEEMLAFVDQAKCALMLTRRDTQGVMSCELMTYGIPLVTSDLPICHEMFDGIETVIFLNNEEIQNRKTVLPDIIGLQCHDKVDKYFSKNTIQLEVNLIKNNCSFCGT